MPYVLLAGAIVTEVIGTSLLKSTQGFTRVWPTAGCVACYLVAFVLLARAISAGMKVGVGYALWSALGTTLIVLIGVLFLGEKLTVVSVAGLVLVVAGVVLLNLGGAH
ncbi:ligand-binding protein SH3 [Mangrovactinospora gilvigrisea]|uniref:Ligand-binding protein SH3 n=1 Tax=Mangrovactinospora gilvigrisea TaxID=1428644 RepID=A0A1J7CA16_9ACTN|nr:SMR family transporter [Mangrovactinospora gilvigrisea]OIV36490.1 ligand-binding protein SH3 [Mangrovactinospora gilvigrisea]